MHFVLASGFWSEVPEELQAIPLPPRLTFQAGLARAQAALRASPHGAGWRSPAPTRGEGEGGAAAASRRRSPSAPGLPARPRRPAAPSSPAGHGGHSARRGGGPAGTAGRGDRGTARRGASAVQHRAGGKEPRPGQALGTAAGLREALAGTCALRGPGERSAGPLALPGPAPSAGPPLRLRSGFPAAFTQHTPHPRPPPPIPSTTPLLVLCTPTFCRGKCKELSSPGAAPACTTPAPQPCQTTLGSAFDLAPCPVNRDLHSLYHGRKAPGCPRSGFYTFLPLARSIEPPAEGERGAPGPEARGTHGSSKSSLPALCPRFSLPCPR